jgi:hypothetical protein
MPYIVRDWLEICPGLAGGLKSVLDEIPGDLSVSEYLGVSSPPAAPPPVPSVSITAAAPSMFSVVAPVPSSPSASPITRTSSAGSGLSQAVPPSSRASSSLSAPRPLIVLGPETATTPLSLPPTHIQVRPVQRGSALGPVAPVAAPIAGSSTPRPAPAASHPSAPPAKRARTGTKPSVTEAELMPKALVPRDYIRVRLSISLSLPYLPSDFAFLSARTVVTRRSGALPCSGLSLRSVRAGAAWFPAWSAFLCRPVLSLAFSLLLVPVCAYVSLSAPPSDGSS